jgi:hypothetical protein
MLIRAKKIAISLETTQQTGKIQCGFTKDYLEVYPKKLCCKWQTGERSSEMRVQKRS